MRGGANSGAIDVGNGPKGGNGNTDSGDGHDGGETCGNPEVHVIGVYEARGDHSGGSHPTGNAVVHVERTGPQVLVLSSYEPVNWKVTAVPNANIQYILALGYHAQSVEAPQGVQVKVLDYETQGVFAGCAYEYPDDDPHSGCETPQLLEEVKRLTGQEVSSFHGCYQGTSFTLHADLSADSSCPAGSGGGYNLSGYVSQVCSAGDGDGNGGGEACGNPEVHVLGVYEARGDHSGGSHPTGNAVVHVERTGPQVLVLSSYEPVNWKVSAVPGANIQYILALGYHAQRVEAPQGVEVKVLDYETRGSYAGCAYEYPDDDPHRGCETPQLLEEVKRLTGQEVSSFHGCYQATSFTLHGDLSAGSSCPAAPGGDYNLSGYVSQVCSASLIAR
ncbi:hypothetical protein BO221_27770 [Archangium sp. Cb G35]|nr:hypothetical protein BO221_27770 [Archangium sp. Cb G35]